MITKKLGDEIFAWSPNAWNGKGYWFVLGTNGGLGRAASKKEASALKNPNKEPAKSKLPRQNSPKKSEIGNKMEENAGQLKKKFEPSKMAKGVTGTKTSNKSFSQQTPQVEQKSVKASVPQAMSGGAVNGVSSGNALIDALTSLYELIKNNLDSEKKQKEIQKNFEEEKLVEADRAAKTKEKDIKDIEKAKKKPKIEKIKEEPVEKAKAEKVKPEAAKAEAAKAPKPEAAKAPKPEAAKVPKAEPVKPPSVPKPSAEAVKPPAPSAVTPKTTTMAKAAAKVSPVMIGGSKGLVLGALVAAGYSKSAQANIMANVEKESNFNPRSEEIPKPEKIFSMFGPPGVKGGQPENGKNKVRFQTLQEAQDIVAAGPEAYFNKVYDGRMGNTSPGDGYKYRGRGFIQITGKDMYNRIGKIIGEDLVGNPDSANKPEIAAKIIPAFFQLKLKERKLNTEDYNDINVVNTVVGSADTKSREQRKTLAAAYANELNSGSQLAAASTENKDLKAQQKQAQAPVIVNNTTNNVKQGDNKTVATGGTINDDPPYQQVM